MTPTTATKRRPTIASWPTPQEQAVLEAVAARKAAAPKSGHRAPAPRQPVPAWIASALLAILPGAGGQFP